MRVTILTYVEREASREVDSVVGQVERALREAGHETDVLAIYGDVERLVREIRARKPDLVFNLMEMFAEDVQADMSVAGLLDLLGIPYTGGGPGELYLTQDKALGKKLLKFHGVKYPDFAVFYPDSDFETGGNLHMPLFVKPMRADASIGIDERSLVHGSTELMERVVKIHRELGDAALAEEYIEGRELYVGVLGNKEPFVFPPMEMQFDGDGPHILDEKAKWDRGSPAWAASRARIADIPDELRAKLENVSLTAYRALKVRDYGRVDLRLTEANDIYVIEVNANCYLEEHDEFPTAAKEAGIEYGELIERIASLALERRRAPVKHEEVLTDAPA